MRIFYLYFKIVREAALFYLKELQRGVSSNHWLLLQLAAVTRAAAEEPGASSGSHTGAGAQGLISLSQPCWDVSREAGLELAPVRSAVGNQRAA